MSRRAKRAPNADEDDAERARRDFLDAVNALTHEDVAQRIAQDGRAEDGRQQPRRGKALPVVETIDLHRLTGDQAIARLRTAFQRLAGSEGSVRVIVGKGIHSPDGVSVLRETVPNWMDTTGRTYVAEWRWARLGEGGPGALIVRLRRPRSAIRS